MVIIDNLQGSSKLTEAVDLHHDICIYMCARFEILDHIVSHL